MVSWHKWFLREVIMFHCVLQNSLLSLFCVFPTSEGKCKLTEKYSWHNDRHNNCKTRGKKLLCKRSNQHFSASHLKIKGWVLFTTTLCLHGQATVAWPAEGRIASWKVVWGSEWIKQLKYEHVVDATAGGSNVFGDIYNWEMKTRNVMLKCQYRNTAFVHDHRKYCRKEIMVWESGGGERNAEIGPVPCCSAWKCCLN